MKSLKERLAEYGFIANQNFDYPVQCLLAAQIGHIRCLNVEGHPGRRKTAFAHALAHALGYHHVLYHEFHNQHDQPQPVRIPTSEEETPGEQPVEALDQVISEACALSEGEKTILILDQLQFARFVHHLRLADFLQSRNWSYADLTLTANPANLMLFLISEEPLYHTLQQNSFRIWVEDEGDTETPHITPQTLGLGAKAQDMLQALNIIFAALELRPTLPEYQKLVHDIQLHVRTPEDLKISLYGWIEGLDRNKLYSSEINTLIQEQMPAIEAYLGLDHEAIVLELNVPTDEQSH
jgi:hypothetical protein